MTTLPHLRITASGTLGTGAGDEIWSCATKVGLTVSGSPGTLVAASADDCGDMLISALTAWTNLITTQASGTTGVAGQLFSDNVALTQVKVSAVVASGHDDPAIDPAVFGLSTGNRGLCPAASDAQEFAQLPYAVAVVATFKGATFLKGAAANGRIYLPGPNIFANNLFATAPVRMVNGLMGAASGGPCDLFSSAVATLLGEFNSATLTSGKVPFAANISTSAALAGIRWQPVFDVTVDSRPDTVRRRQNKISGRGSQTALV